eukprot:TRINITY_DN28367_c0_g1_i1.p3 TRINITY_DN28367_c0_g1~~TRINITY_DN28367_c0_g1_i1.p3  ORF type:complete len:185 (+),score=48.53 TRINITY_DN28367_c0_g1_i1:54-608(+)
MLGPRASVLPVDPTAGTTPPAGVGDASVCLELGREAWDAEAAAAQPLRPGAEVQCPAMTVAVARGKVAIAEGARGVVRAHDAGTGCYTVDVPGKGVRVAVPAGRLLKRASPPSPVMNLRKRPIRSNLSPKPHAPKAALPLPRRVSFGDEGAAPAPPPPPVAMPPPMAHRPAVLPPPRLPEAVSF